MDQISRPFQIALLLTVLLAGLWFVALRPSPEEPATAPAPQAPAPSAAGQAPSAVPGPPGRALDRARAGADQASADAAARPGRADAAAGEGPAPGPFGRAVGASPSSSSYRGGAAVGAEAQERLLTSDNAAVLSGMVALSLVRISLEAGQEPGGGSAARRGASPQAVERALARRRAVVLLFYGRGSDDRGVRSELARVNRRGGRVVVLSAPISRVAGFGAITQGVRVLAAPTVLVVGPARQARALPGYTDHTEIDQAAQSALRGR